MTALRLSFSIKGKLISVGWPEEERRVRGYVEERQYA